MGRQPSETRSTDFEKLGSFYLGRPYDLAAGAPRAGLVLYDSRDLTTHAVIVGMTGSGKTGLGIGLIEEAALDDIPVLAIDPKGDLPNLLLTFPNLAPADFEPWVSEEEARRHGQSRPEWAEAQAELWKKSLADWGQDAARVRRLREVPTTVYTPGSTAGVPLSILDSFRAPAPALREDAELLSERAATTATSLLSLLGREADPLRSRDHILLATLLEQAWRAGSDLDLPALIQQIQRPPLSRVGVVAVDTFYPEKDRFALAMAVNNLLAAPGFEVWLAGEGLDPARLLHDASGRPRVAIVSIAHLPEAERMFVVTLLLEAVVSWMRGQAGTSSLRALLYMDEVFGYLPPVAEPPSKKPLLTLLKQARAYGLGVVLATQNPVDLDYKALSNAGTWFVGRLQTERDKARLLDGLEGAAAGGRAFDRRAVEATIAGLESRVFLLHDVREDEPQVFETRWVLSYLAGPMTRDQIRRASAERGGAGPGEPGARAGRADAAASGTASAAARPAAAAAPASAQLAAAPPALPPDIPQRFLAESAAGNDAPMYHPGLLGIATVHFADRRRGVETQERLRLFLPLDSGAVLDWAGAEPLGAEADAASAEPPATGRFAALPVEAGRSASYARWRKSLAEWLYRSRRLELFRSPTLGEVSRAGETRAEFLERLRQLARERRDAEVETLRARHEKRAQALAGRLHKAQQRVDREQDQVERQRYENVVSVGATVLSALLGRKRVSMSSLGRATTAARGMGRSRGQAADVERAELDVEHLQAEIAELEQELAAAQEEMAARFEVTDGGLETVALAPRRTDIEVHLLGLAWRAQ